MTNRSRPGRAGRVTEMAVASAGTSGATGRSGGPARPLRSGVLSLWLVSVACCGPGGAQPVAGLAFAVSPPRVPMGTPVEATLTFSVLPDARLDEDYRVFLHFLNTDGELLWTADHFPPRPTSEWQPGSTVEYTRTILVPLCPYRGDADVQVGLYSVNDGDRLALVGDDVGQLAYRAGTLRLLLPAENIRFTYRSGWHLPEHDATCTQWRWSEKVGVIAFDNPRRDSVLSLNLDNLEAWDEPRTVAVSVGDLPADRFEVLSGTMVQQIPLSAALLGDADEVEVRLEVDRTFVPAELPNSDNPDTRTLGLRVLGAHLAAAKTEPRGAP